MALHRSAPLVGRFGPGLVANGWSHPISPYTPCGLSRKDDGIGVVGYRKPSRGCRPIYHIERATHGRERFAKEQAKEIPICGNNSLGKGALFEHAWSLDRAVRTMAARRFVRT